jgi:hypothetical protein
MQLLVNVEKLIGSRSEEEQEKLKAALTASTATLVEVDLPLFVEKEANKGVCCGLKPGSGSSTAPL